MSSSVNTTTSTSTEEPRFFMEEIGGAWEVNEREGKSVWSLFYGPKEEAQAMLDRLLAPEPKITGVNSEGLCVRCYYIKSHEGGCGEPCV